MLPLLRRHLIPVLWFYAGLSFCSLGYALMIRPRVGSAPWDVFHMGISGQMGAPLAIVMQVAGLAIILINVGLEIKPTLGMVLNMLSVGPMVQTMLAVMPMPETLAGRWAMLAAGVLVAGLGTALYVSAGIGSGPRDGMMIGLTRKLGIPVGFVKNGIDIAVAATGWLMGGPLGLGTVFAALTLGPSIQFGMALVRRLAVYEPFSSFVHPVQLKKAPAPNTVPI